MEDKQLSFIRDEEYKAPKKFKPLLLEHERPTKVVAPNPPPNTKIPSGYNWCPYCAKVIKLIKDKSLGVYRCPLCGISSEDYYMKFVKR